MITPQSSNLHAQMLGVGGSTAMFGGPGATVGFANSANEALRH
jgi:hypothetical protein